ncbi:MAG: 6-pyruvoyl tetrahydropterin synthase [Synechococcaceae bacterium WBB_32_011]|nr:6-pyruvoyl tetrahydropterin synthase [Synechococcaceae bacterium WBB_32_011]
MGFRALTVAAQVNGHAATADLAPHGQGRACVITRRACFSASHHYWLPELDEVENNRRFGPCSQVHAIWQRLQPLLPLKALRLYEQPTLWADYLGNAMEAFLTIRTHFSAAHRLARPELSQQENEQIYGKCARPHGHGHNYFLEVTVRGQIDARTGMVCDLAALQQLVQDLVVEPFDHTFLNKDVPFFADCVPTAENIALHISDRLNQPIAAIGAALHKIHLQESPNNAAVIYAEAALV